MSVLDKKMVRLDVASCYVSIQFTCGCMFRYNENNERILDIVCNKHHDFKDEVISLVEEIVEGKKHDFQTGTEETPIQNSREEGADRNGHRYLPESSTGLQKDHPEESCYRSRPISTNRDQR